MGEILGSKVPSRYIQHRVNSRRGIAGLPVNESYFGVSGFNPSVVQSTVEIGVFIQSVPLIVMSFNTVRE